MDAVFINLCVCVLLHVFTRPEAVVTHGVDRRDVVRTDVAIVDGGVGFGDPVRLPPVRVGSDLLQQPELHRAALVIPPADQTDRRTDATTGALRP